VGNVEGIKDHALKRCIGHKPEGMTDKHYRGIRPEDLLTVAQKVKLSEKVEARMKAELASDAPV
jgi:hypothetical protein